MRSFIRKDFIRWKNAEICTVIAAFLDLDLSVFECGARDCLRLLIEDIRQVLFFI